MKDIFGQLSRMAAFFNGYYEAEKNKNHVTYVKAPIDSYCNDNIFCKLFCSKLEAIEHVNERGRPEIPSRLEKEHLLPYLSLVNDSYLYVIYDCDGMKPENNDLSSIIELPHIEKLITKLYPSISYKDALSLIKEIENITQYGYFDVYDYYSDGISFHYKVIKIDEIVPILKRYFK